MKYNNGDLALGIDIGGTNTAFGIVDRDGKILCRGCVPTSGDLDFREFIVSLHKAVEKTLHDAGIDYKALKAIGFGAPCLNWKNGVIEGAVNLPWPSPLALTDELSREFGLPAFGENDANAAAIGEMYFGAGKGLDNFIMITLGTGVGGAVICDGRLLHGKRGLAGELGHIPVVHTPDARLCSCGRKGCLDAYATARGIVSTAKELLAASETSSPLRDMPDFDAKAVGEAAASGDPIALETFRLTGELLGRACADFAAFSSPEAFIFFGGITGSFHLFEQPMIEAFNKHLLWIYDGQIDFRKSLLPQSDAALLGAAALTLNS